ncbi:Uu.00g048110.m01.CDS01 [Anthostomella pinea]|uniref:4a-hydroxytetrahydrobiopterin dehydratase n=1 Tax=Anthostomella pinea TaxID=933095 RepID=A0AAI8VBS1_9PEZI|nr:Uu.00g048110.m01.CDS01 [Anthostomella pinea]
MASPSTAQINFSPGVDETALTKALQPLLASAGEGGRWAVVPGGEGLERSFKFKTFAKTWVYNTTYIRWTTHSPKGLSAKDVELAAACDGLARDFGEIVEDEEDGGATRELKQVADRVVANAGDCCAPKK